MCVCVCGCWSPDAGLIVSVLFTGVCVCVCGCWSPDAGLIVSVLFTGVCVCVCVDAGVRMQV